MSILARRWPGLIQRQSPRGYPYWVYERVMPRIADELLEAVIYLYRSTEDAEQGIAAGGSGFLVHMTSSVSEELRPLYAVTNSHVVREGDAPVVRLNTRDGKTDTLPLTSDDWIHHPDGDDIAVCPIGLTPEFHHFKSISREDWFLKKEEIEERSIGPGDEVFSSGVFCLRSEGSGTHPQPGSETFR